MVIISLINVNFLFLKELSFFKIVDFINIIYYLSYIFLNIDKIIGFLF